MKNKIIPVILTISVIAMLILSGSAEAFELNMRLSDSNVIQGNTIIITPTIQVTSEDSNLPVKDLVLIVENINGNPKKTCKFDINGNKLSSCDNVLNIRLVESTSQQYGYGYGYYLGIVKNYGYGYGYTQGNLTYEITLSTENLPEGTYSTAIQVKIKDEVFEKIGGNFIVSPKTIIESDSGRSTGYILESQRTSYSNEEKLEIRENGKYKFKYGNQDHTIDVNNINLNSINLVVHSTPKNVELRDKSTIDLDDEVYAKNDIEDTEYTTNDLEMKVLYVGEEENEATISLKGLNNTIELEEHPYVKTTEIAPTSESLKAQPVLEEKGTYNFNGLIKNPLSWLILFIILNLIMIILIIVRRR